MTKSVACLGIVLFGVLPVPFASAQGMMNEPQDLGPGCHFGEVIDASTPDDARMKIEAAGFTDVSGLKKSCDNFWHGHAIQAGKAVNVVLSPAGKVLLEGN